VSVIEYQRRDHTISTDNAKLDIDVIYDFLSQQSYWALGRPRALVEKSINNSLCFGVYQEKLMVGFARVVTDFATFAWLCDVFILEKFRGQGLGQWLIESAVNHPELKGLKHFILATKDAHELYRERGGFEALPNPAKWMARPRNDV